MLRNVKPIAAAVILSGCALAGWRADAAPVHRPAPAGKPDTRLVTFDTCVRVIEGDLIEGKKVGQIRLVGVIAPTQGETGFHEAIAYTRKLVLGRQFKLDICSERPNDYRDRLRAIVYLPDSTNLNTKLLLAGVVRVLEHKPCHVNVGSWIAYETEARKAKRGVWTSARTERASEPVASSLAPRRRTGSGRVHIRPKR